VYTTRTLLINLYRIRTDRLHSWRRRRQRRRDVSPENKHARALLYNYIYIYIVYKKQIYDIHSEVLFIVVNDRANTSWGIVSSNINNVLITVRRPCPSDTKTQINNFYFARSALDIYIYICVCQVYSVGFFYCFRVYNIYVNFQCDNATSCASPYKNHTFVMCYQDFDFIPGVNTNSSFDEYLCGSFSKLHTHPCWTASKICDLFPYNTFPERQMYSRRIFSWKIRSKHCIFR